MKTLAFLLVLAFTTFTAMPVFAVSCSPRSSHSTHACCKKEKKASNTVPHTKNKKGACHFDQHCCQILGQTISNSTFSFVPTCCFILLDKGTARCCNSYQADSWQPPEQAHVYFDRNIA